MATILRDTNNTGLTAFDISRITLAEEPDITNVATSQINQTLNTQELKTVKKLLSSNVPFEVRLLNFFNSKKDEIQLRLIPFIVKQLTPFGSSAVQFIVNSPDLFKQGVTPQETEPILIELKEYVNCPNGPTLLQLINKRNSTAKQINNLYQTVKIINKTTNITNTVLAAVQAGIIVIRTLPYPAPGIPPFTFPAGLPPLTTGIIELTGAGADTLQDRLNISRLVLSDLNITAASFGTLLGSSLNLLNILDILIQQCSENQDIPFITINNEINLLNEQSQITTQTQDNLIYKGFKLELQLDKANQIKYPQRFAQALNKQGVPVLKTESSFASNPQVLIDQLKFIIDSNPNLTAE
jgi:hypothetical protein